MAMKGKSKLIDIFVWDVNNKEVLANLTGFHLRAIQLLKFSPSGQNLFSFGKDDDNSLAVYDWKNQRLLATAKVDKKNVLDISFMSENDFLTVGSKHVKMWKLNGTRVQGTKLSWKGSCKPESVLCCQGVPKFGYVIGTIKGKLIPVRGGIGVPIQAH
jgi:microtubule-associated protein-like 6